MVGSKHEGDQEQFPEANQERRRDDALRRALAMPPQKHKAQDKPDADPRRPKQSRKPKKGD